MGLRLSRSLPMSIVATQPLLGTQAFPSATSSVGDKWWAKVADNAVLSDM